MEKLFPLLTLLTALGSGLIAGAFFIFSVAIMRAFGRLPANEGAAAMNMINVVIINPFFLGVFLGTGLLCALVAVRSMWVWQPESPWILAGALLYLVGCLGVTMAFNVPLNNALAENPASVWTNYVSTWTLWNHVRTAASLGAAASFIVALSR